ncbi:hypothetical protein G6F65_019794 [Rhizopus arrhizus]|nr:hypothetical protein G6F65_019794 [Rhizopus arrhizus]
MEALFEFHAIGANILNGRCPHHPRNQRQVLQAVPAVVYAGFHEAVPVLAARGLDQPRVRPRLQQAHAPESHLRNQARHPLGQYHIAAAAQYQEGVGLSRQLRQSGQLRRVVQCDKRVGAGRQPQRIQTGQVLGSGD